MNVADCVIWSFKHNAWWRHGRMGYTHELQHAGRYTAAEAGEICANSILFDSILMRHSVAQAEGPPRFHPRTGKEAT